MSSAPDRPRSSRWGPAPCSCPSRCSPPLFDLVFGYRAKIVAERIADKGCDCGNLMIVQHVPERWHAVIREPVQDAFHQEVGVPDDGVVRQAGADAAASLGTVTHGALAG